MDPGRLLCVTLFSFSKKGLERLVRLRQARGEEAVYASCNQTPLSTHSILLVIVRSSALFFFGGLLECRLVVREQMLQALLTYARKVEMQALRRSSPARRFATKFYPVAIIVQLVSSLYGKTRPD